ncbi:Rieske (2Fe-2S) protein [Sphingomonas radiodurans]|uniref:Rieske (2Fe-2S) protein n=1 Tax=Sphingomonas radiodurans TaxID=2890321 RepID=UPI001E5B83C2|nr:Rieske (2Fe-2S) protein [Sphingomonas radiodurans]WBH16058.1 Rieske (2Fe-2S) protein [Sphingomonas radiodurans]
MLGRFPQGAAPLTERLTATPAGVSLGALDQIADGAARSFVLELLAGRFHGFVVRCGHEVFGYLDKCPHLGLPLAQKLDDYVAAGQIACSWHGALFDIATGACLVGPCYGAGLTPWPVRVEAGTIVTA